MCGIAGSITSSPLAGTIKEKTLESIKHRGPDGARNIEIPLSSGKFLNLFFSRLAIIDTSDSAMQPIETPNSILVLNGEIYNYEYLRQKISRGIRFKSRGDVEVAAHYFDEYGIESLRDLDGMFALARFDKLNEDLALSRDFFGEKPLYIYEDTNGLFFASEIMALKSMSPNTINVSAQMISNLLWNGYKHLNWSNETFFDGVKKVEAGQVLHFTREGLLTRDYFFEERSKTSAEEISDYGEAKKLVRDTLVKVVESRMVSDVPFAFSLSGGIDSSVLVAIAKRCLGKDIDTFFLQSSDPRYDETEQVIQISSYLNLDTQIVKGSENLESLLYALSSKRSTPVITSTYLVHARLLEAMSKSGIKVSLMGTAADELFSGYYDHYLANFRDLRDLALYEALRKAKLDWESTTLPSIRNEFLRQHDYYIKNAKAREHNHYESTTLKRFLVKDIYGNHSGDLPYRDSFLRNRMKNELFHETTPVILSEDDANSMFFSIENRSPYLSKDLFRLLDRIPQKFLIQRGLAKFILRDTFADLLPRNILFETKKTGFNASIWEIFPALSDTHLMKSITKNGAPIWDFVRVESFAELLSRARGDVRLEKLLFSILSINTFLEVN
jgi:asparagine synthase (glutamine-hydrolysing)